MRLVASCVTAFRYMYLLTFLTGSWRRIFLLVPVTAIIVVTVHCYISPPHYATPIMNIYEPLHEKTYDLDWRHNMLKWCRKIAGEIPKLKLVDDACALPQLVICLFVNGFSVWRYQNNGNMLLYTGVVHILANPSQTKFYKITITMKIHVTSFREIQTTNVYDVIS